MFGRVIKGLEVLDLIEKGEKKAMMRRRKREDIDATNSGFCSPPFGQLRSGRTINQKA